MSKALITAGNVDVDTIVNTLYVPYTVGVLDDSGVAIRYASNYMVDFTKTIAVNVTAVKTKVMNEVNPKIKGTKLLLTDIILFGSPV